jgi:hypothetical protein
LITSSHDDSDRDRNEQTIAVDCGLQRSFRRNDDLATHPPQQLDAFGPLPFSATMKAQRIYHAHWVNLTDIRSGAIVISQCLNAGIVPASGPKRRAMYQLNIPAAKVRVSRQPILRARAF